MINNVDFAVLSAAPKTLTEEEKSVLLYVVALIMRVSHTARRYGLLEVDLLLKNFLQTLIMTGLLKRRLFLLLTVLSRNFLKNF